MNSIARGDLPETVLLSRARDGDMPAFCELVRRSEKAIFLAAWAVLMSDVEAEDAAAAAAFKALATLHEFRGDSTFTLWMVRIAVDQARLKRPAAEPFDAACDPLPVPCSKVLTGWTEIPSNALDNPAFRTALCDAIKRLDANARIVFVLRDVQRFSIQDTARILAISADEVRTRLARARLQVTGELAPGLNSNLANTEPRRQRAQSC